MTAALLMVLGGLVWLVGELIGVFTGGPTTSGFVWAIEKRWPVLRILVAAALAVLGLHFEFGVPLWIF